MLTYRKPAFWIIIFIVLLMAALLVFFIINPIKNTADGQGMKEENPTENMSSADVSSDYANDEQDKTSDKNTTVTLTEVMDRILEATPLEEAKTLTSTADLPTGDQLYFLDATENGKYVLYGFHSDEYGYSGMMINYVIDGEDNWNYLEDITHWIGYEFPTIAETEDGGLLMQYCFAGGTGTHIDKLFFFKAYETGTLERFELTGEDMLAQTEKLVSFELNKDKEEVQVYDLENGKKELFALMPYADDLNGRTEEIQGIRCCFEQTGFLFEPLMVKVAVGLEQEGSVIPVYVDELAFRIRIVENEEGVSFELYDVSTYHMGGIEE